MHLAYFREDHDDIADEIRGVHTDVPYVEEEGQDGEEV